MDAALTRSRWLLLPPVVAVLLLTAVDGLLTLRALPSAAGAPGFGWLLPLLALAGPLLEVPLAMLAPRVGSRRLAVAAAVAAALAAGGSAVGWSPVLFIVFRIAGFVAEAVLVPVLAAVVAGWVPARSRTASLAWLVAALTLGPVLASAMWTYAAPYLPGAAAFTFVAAAWVGVAGWMWWALPGRSGRVGWLDDGAAQALAWARQAEPRSRRRAERAPTGLGDVRLALLAGVALVLGLSASSAAQWIGALFREMPQRPVFDVVLAMLAAVVAVAWALALDRSGKVAAGLALAMGLGALGFAAAVLRGPNWQTMGGLAGHAVALASGRAMLLSLVARLRREGGAAEFAAVDAAGRAGMLLGPFVVVWLAHASGALQTAMLGVAMLLGVGFALALLLRNVSEWD